MSKSWHRYRCRSPKNTPQASDFQTTWTHSKLDHQTKVHFCFSSSSGQCISSSKRTLTIRFQLRSQVCAVHAAPASTSTSLQYSTLGNSILRTHVFLCPAGNMKFKSTCESAVGVNVVFCLGPYRFNAKHNPNNVWSETSAITVELCTVPLDRTTVFFYSYSAGDRLQSWSLPYPEPTPHWCETLQAT
jgi:hypothetical protein